MADTELPSKLLWIDLEMTGLDASRHVIIEVAAIVTDFSLNELALYEQVIHQTDDELEAADDWPKQNMQGLFEQVRSSTVSNDDAQAELLKITDTYFAGEKVILAGNSIHNDRRYIARCWPKLESRLHYRMFDVTTLKIWLQGTLKEQMSKKEAHRALDDIRESIEELKWCLQKISDK
jgi:oligoribonuclease